MQLTVYGATDPGRRHTQNEDCVLFFTTVAESTSVGVYAVADGMGGHHAGEVASQITVDTVEQELRHFLDRTFMPAAATEGYTTRLPESEPAFDAPPPSFRDALLDTMQRCNQRIREYGDANPDSAGLGSTLTIALLVGDLALIGNIGDSRTYLVREGTIRRLTEDHSLVNSLVRQGLITDEDVYTHPHRNVVLQAVGTRPELNPDVSTERLQAGDILLLCSDGLWEMVRDPDILQIVTEETAPQPLVQRLIDSANENGGVDNISAVAVFVA